MKVFLALCVLLAALAFAYLGDGAPQPPQQRSPDSGLSTLAVHDLQPAPQQDSLLTFGQVQARWRVSLKSEVAGRVLDVAETALVGARVPEGTTLVVIEDTAQRLAVANRTADLAQTDRLLQEEEQRARIAEENWRVAGYTGDPEPLVLRIPQLREARKKHESAQLALTRARYLLDQTRIEAPFTGAILRRWVSPGDVVQVGSEIVEIYDTSRMEVVLPLTEAEISRLGGALGAHVALSSEQTGQRWSGVVDRIGQQVESKNRWVNLIVTINTPKGLVPGQFLRAEIRGQNHPSLFAVPHSLVGRDGAIWRLTGENRLERVVLRPLFSRDGISFVEPRPDWLPVLRLTPPSSSYLEGTRVIPDVVAPAQTNDMGTYSGQPRQEKDTQ